MSDPLERYASLLHHLDMSSCLTNDETVIREFAAALRAEREQAAKLREELERLRKAAGACAKTESVL